MKIDVVNGWIQEHQTLKNLVVPKIICKDGYMFSVQASKYHYCTPRTANGFPYTHFEIGYPSGREETLMGYAEDKDRPTDTVYGYVPLKTVLEVIEAHGGMKEE